MLFVLTKANSILFAFKNHAWLVFKPKMGTLNLTHLNKMFGMFELMLSLYSRVFVLRVDLFPTEYHANNQFINNFISTQQKQLKEIYGCEISIMCAREQNSSDKEHYHLVILASAHKIRHSKRIVQLLKDAWRKAGGSHLSAPRNCYNIVCRGIKASLVAAIYRASYLTKTHTKELNPKGFANVLFKKPNVTYSVGDTDILLVDPQFSDPLPVLRSKFNDTTDSTSAEQSASMPSVASSASHDDSPAPPAFTLPCDHRQSAS